MSRRSSSSGYVREAAHAGSWYSSDQAVLSRQLQGWLDDAVSPPSAADDHKKSEAAATAAAVRAVICPHAGYRYSGATAAYSYAKLATASDRVSRIFVLGPAHHLSSQSCLVTKATSIATPVGNIPVDREVIKQLLETSMFDELNPRDDETEHSLEMQFPYIAHIMKDKAYKIVPVMVGHISKKDQETYGKIFGPYLDDSSNAFVISSDFCHWGERFGYTPYDPKQGEIWQSIEAMDHQGMSLIEGQDAGKFSEYLAETSNTICGRKPILLFLNAIKFCTTKFTTKFVHYAQSSRCLEDSDSSVSYAAGIVFEASV